MNYPDKLAQLQGYLRNLFRYGSHGHALLTIACGLDAGIDGNELDLECGQIELVQETRQGLHFRHHQMCHPGIRIELFLLLREKFAHLDPVSFAGIERQSESLEPLLGFGHGLIDVVDQRADRNVGGLGIFDDDLRPFFALGND